MIVRKRKHEEDSLQAQVIRYLATQYPEAMVYTNPMSGMKLSLSQAARIKRLGHRAGFPDIMIFEPRWIWRGLFIELKKEGESPYKLDGTLRKNEHLERQERIIRALQDRGYQATFAVGFYAAVMVIDGYMNNDGGER
jgi:hypothetical protein